MRGILALSAVGLFVGCMGHAAGSLPGALSKRCVSASSLQPARLDSVALEQPTGTFRLVVVDTIGLEEPFYVQEAELVLDPVDPDMASQARAGRIGHRPRQALCLRGTITWEAVENGQPQPAEVDGDSLYLGCRDCLDGDPDHLVVREVTPTGFRGTWRNYQSGISVLFRRDGTPAADPAGYYCAWARPDTASRREKPN
jgi:hypothetical protein